MKEHVWRPDRRGYTIIPFQDQAIHVPAHQAASGVAHRHHKTGTLLIAPSTLWQIEAASPGRDTD